jgi:hypothetical protein
VELPRMLPCQASSQVAGWCLPHRRSCSPNACDVAPTPSWGHISCSINTVSEVHRWVRPPRALAGRTGFLTHTPQRTVARKEKLKVSKTFAQGA